MSFKILQIIPNLNLGGAERLVVDICNNFVEKGHKAGIVIKEKTIEFDNLNPKVEIFIVKDEINLRILKKNIIQLENFEKVVKIFQPNIVHSHLFSSELISRWEPSKKIKYFSHVHWNTIEMKKSNIFQLSKKNVTNRYEKNILQNKYKLSKTKFLCVSKECLNFYLKNLSLPKERFIYFPNAINFQVFVNKSKKKIGNSSIKLITIGRLDKNKNHKFSILIVEALKKQGHNVILTIVGDGPLKMDLLEYVKLKKLTKNVFFLGKVKNIQETLWQHNLYLHTALSESFGLTILEAMASGLPVITLDAKGNRDYIEHKKNGFIFKTQDIYIFIDCILELLSNKNLYNSVSNQGVATSKIYDINSYCNRLLSLYKE